MLVNYLTNRGRLIRKCQAVDAELSKKRKRKDGYFLPIIENAVTAMEALTKDMDDALAFILDLEDELDRNLSYLTKNLKGENYEKKLHQQNLWMVFGSGNLPKV